MILIENGWCCLQKHEHEHNETSHNAATQFTKSPYISWVASISNYYRHIIDQAKVLLQKRYKHASLLHHRAISFNTLGICKRPSSLYWTNAVRMLQPNTTDRYCIHQRHTTRLMNENFSRWLVPSLSKRMIPLYMQEPTSSNFSCKMIYSFTKYIYHNFETYFLQITLVHEAPTK